MDESAPRQAIRDVFNKTAPNVALNQLAAVHWAAVLSCAMDSYFEERFKQEREAHVVGQLVTVLSDAALPVPPRSIPVFKLMGDLTRDDFAASNASYRRRRGKWRFAVKSFADTVRASPIFCVGLGDCPWALLDLLSVAGDPASSLSTLIFLSDDPLVMNAELQRSVDRTRLLQITASISNVCAAATTSMSSTLSGTQGAESADPFQAKLAQLSELAIFVNDKLTSEISRNERRQLHDILFSPAVPRWDPYVHGLDFQRTATSDILGRIRTLLGFGILDGACVLHGSAAGGKTVILKRLSYELAKAGHKVIWLRPWFFQDSQVALNNLFSAFAKADLKQVVCVVDDPVGFGSLSVRDVSNAARNAGLKLLLLIGARSSDWATRSRSDFIAQLNLLVEFELPDKLDELEWGRFPEYLVKIGNCRDISEANKKTEALTNRYAKDMLSMLYWMLDETKGNISSSLRDEYFRLGDSAAFARVLIGNASQTSAFLKSAYEMVAVSDAYGTALPIEVLVSALQIDYADWLETARPHGPTWGLIYPDGREEENTLSYRPRNAVVTRTVQEIINGGRTGHSGDLRVLKALLRACFGSQPAYREFCIRILVRPGDIQNLSFEEGLDLYDTAINALPLPDKTLQHHRGLWIKNRGENPLLAAQALEAALGTPMYPYATKGEADEHIHTSIAASYVDAILAKKIGLEEGRVIALSHLEKARSASFFNPSAVHAKANLVIKLAGQMGNAQSADVAQLLNRAIADVDQTLLCLPEHHEKDTTMLVEIRGKMLTEAGTEGECDARANKFWTDFHNQQGFVLASRKRFDLAWRSGKGRSFAAAYAYAGKAIDLVRIAGATPTPELYEVAAHIYYRWLVKPSGAPRGSNIEWKTLRELSEGAMGSVVLQHDPMNLYINALARAHLRDWPIADGLFAKLRQMGIFGEVLWAPRDWLRGSNGAVLRVQGTMTRGGERQFLNVPDLGTDFRTERQDRWPRVGEIAHAYVRFAFAGPTATIEMSRI
jgi:hypothetical protein